MTQTDDAEIVERWKDETDTVEAQFGGEYSDATIDIVRDFPKPEWIDEPSSLDPIEDLEEYAEHDLRLPPSTYDKVQQAADEEAEEIRAIKNVHLDAEEEAIIKYRKALVEGTSLDDVKLLKLRAYFNAKKELKASQQQQEVELRHKILEDYAVPQDKVPPELIAMTPEQLADRYKLVQHQKKLQQEGSPSTAGHWEEYSEESEWAADWVSTSYLQSDAFKQQLYMAYAPRQVPPEVAHQDETASEFGDVMLFGDPKNVKELKLYREYTPEYLEAQRTSLKLKAQQQQRALAFWLPLTAVLGASVLRGVRRLLLRKKGGPPVKKTEKYAAT
ncbi:hypothetical protein CEUSTIGMA_g10986.t1 [Chlamydomonas eustigma]|uniref:Uncharacterized protein n=1 Tax=Chlamydomonas eustigma TaxID=1157962 RepID=A0A250XKE4_9CHLO|nr:hypothetical protein CEUSTIGMA_g10986.t1 [Chlamydomonas eustigma]|eukprot:GAX83561.1 hypothetical protein CEUSTIGMA_g10986.t1 [Chlamydomonas eustigma]